MPWARFDDRFPSNRKISLLSDRAFRLYVSAVCWSAENLTDGLIPDANLTRIAHVRNINGARNELESCGLWERAEAGWLIHDYHDYNPTREQVIADRKKNAARQEAFRKRKNGKPIPPKGGEEDPSNASSNGVTKEERNGVSNDAPSRTRPDPTPTTGGAEREKGERSSARSPEALSPIPAEWQPSPDDIQAAQNARVAASHSTLTGQQLADVTRKFVRRQTADGRTMHPGAWGSRWQEWAERERAADTPQPPFLFGLSGSDAPAWPHEERRTDSTPMPPSFQERMAQLDAATRTDTA